MKLHFQNQTKVFFLTLFSITLHSVYGQLAVPFKVRHQGYVKGDVAMIANNIVNRVDYNNESNVPYNNRSIQGKLNDEFVMMYVDVDNEKSTFSSSSADLILENQQNKKIIYAGLYWSATYLYNSGKSPDVNKFKAIDAKRESFDKIKIKLPNQEYYNDISGELIFDGIKENNFKESAPYAMYADITDLVKENANPFGSYTVANIKSTIGEISGGVSAGWTIFFVYEDKNMTGKFITSYDGFAGVTEKSTDIQFTGFEALPEGTVNAKIACAALEGDLNLKGDQLLFKAEEDNEFSLLSNTLRDKSNVFNSAITNENDYFNNRFPNSKNTLGYDSFIMTIDNPGNTVIHNTTKDATLRLKTFGDRYFVFFSAFAVEVVKPKDIKDETPIVTIAKPVEIKKVEPVAKIEPKKETPIVTIAKPVEIKKTEPIAKIEPKKETPIITKPVEIKKETPVVTKTEVVKPVEIKKETPVVTKTEVVKPVEIKKETPVVTKTEVVKPIQIKKETPVIAKTEVVKPVEIKKETPVVTKTEVVKPVQTTNNSDLVESPSVTIPTLPQGYYIISGVFAIHKNAMRFLDKIKKDGLYADYFINPVNNYRYIYLTKHKTFEEATAMYDSKIEGRYNDKIWVMTVNKENGLKPFVYQSNSNSNDIPFDENQINTTSLSVGALERKKKARV